MLEVNQLLHCKQLQRNYQSNLDSVSYPYDLIQFSLTLIMLTSWKLTLT